MSMHLNGKVLRTYLTCLTWNLVKQGHLPGSEVSCIIVGVEVGVECQGEVLSLLMNGPIADPPTLLKRNIDILPLLRSRSSKLNINVRTP